MCGLGAILVGVLFLQDFSTGPYQPRDGDIIFQISTSEIGRAVQLVTGSKYSHMGIVFLQDGQPQVYEGVGPVKQTPLAEWIARGNDDHCVVKRLHNSDAVLDASGLCKMRKAGEEFRGRSYDYCFEWSDERFYCSELVWKIYQRGLGIEIGALQHIKQFDLAHPEVQALIHRKCPDLEARADTVISPAAMFAAANLVTVYQN